MMHIIFLPILIILSGFFSAAETALFSLNSFQRKKIRQAPAITAIYASELLDHPRRTLATILIGNMFVNVTATGIATIFFVNIFGENGTILAIIFMTFILLLFGEVTPKTIALHNSEAICAAISLPLLLVGKIVFPIRWVLQKISGVFISLFTKYIPPQPFITEKELKAVISLTKTEGIINKDEEKLIHAIFEFGDRKVSEIMVPREDIAGCDANAKKEELIAIMKKSRHNKIPIFENDISRIKGIVYTKEFMLNPKDEWTEYIKKPLYVHQNQTIDNLLVEFQDKRNFIAIIIDKTGAALGLVTLDDVLNEIGRQMRKEAKGK